MNPAADVAAAWRQRRAMRSVEHRPWPLPERPWLMGQSWERLLFAHWPLPVEDLRAVVPPQLPIDTYDGRAWVGVTPFRVRGLRLRLTMPLPLVAAFPEVNVRTYVTVGGRPGIYFLSLDAGSRLAVEAARRLYRLPYFRARIELSRDGSVRYVSRRDDPSGPPAELSCRYRAAGPSFHARPGSLEHFLTERYCLYTLAGDQVQGAEIHHAPWSLRSAVATFAQNTMGAPFGLSLTGEPLLHLSQWQHVLLWRIGPVDGTSA